VTLHVQAVGVQLNDKGAIKVDEVSATGAAEHVGTMSGVYPPAVQ
jgi:pyruvate/2-oxoglutarate dehydrogenase complex dihydrolipoamide dehydrogenase (E3) component